MDAATLRDLVARGMGKAAQKIGLPYTVFRPHGCASPLDQRNRVIRLFAAFEPESKGAVRDSNPYWRGIFDVLYTRNGDYLTNACQTFFIASQAANLPAQCVLVNRTITVMRPSFTPQANYSGFLTTNGEVVIEGWPGSLLAGHGRSVGGGVVGASSGNWTLLLPSAGLAFHIADVVTDDLHNGYVIAQAQESSVGWKLLLEQVGP